MIHSCGCEQSLRSYGLRLNDKTYVYTIIRNSNSKLVTKMRNWASTRPPRTHAATPDRRPRRSAVSTLDDTRPRVASRVASDAACHEGGRGSVRPKLKALLLFMGCCTSRTLPLCGRPRPRRLSVSSTYDPQYCTDLKHAEVEACPFTHTSVVAAELCSVVDCSTATYSFEWLTGVVVLMRIVEARVLKWPSAKQTQPASRIKREKSLGVAAEEVGLAAVCPPACAAGGGGSMARGEDGGGGDEDGGRRDDDGGRGDKNGVFVGGGGCGGGGHTPPPMGAS